MTSYDPFAMLTTLHRHGVRFVVTGSVAGRLWGSPTMTNEIEICYQRTRENHERLALALAEMGARHRGDEAGARGDVDALTLLAHQNLRLTTRFGALDVLAMPPGVYGFEELSERAVAFDLDDGLEVEVCDLYDLMRMKAASRSLKDRIELEVLGAVREERDRLGRVAVHRQAGGTVADAAPLVASPPGATAVTSYQ